MSIVGGPYGALFQGFAPGEAEAVLAAGATQVLRRGETLFREGEPASALFGLEAGRIKLTQLTAEGREVIMHLVKEHPRFEANLLRIVSSHTREALSRVRELATEPVAQRLARTLLRLAEQIGRREPDGSLLVERITQQEIAEISGTSLFTVSRTLAEWEGPAIVETGRQRFRIRDPQGLAGIAEGR